MKKITVIFGTRPEAIKLAPVILALKGDSCFICQVCVTAQHRKMLDQVIEAFEITPDVDLNLMETNQTLADFTSRAIQALDDYLAHEKPDLVLIQGDTTTVLSTAIAAFYQHIPFGHVEAGLRTGDLNAPWPEEANRVITSRLAALHFAPTDWARGNLVKEGIPEEKITVTGNTVIDALFLAVNKIRANPPEVPGLPSELVRGGNALPLVLITGHRRENFGRGFESICRAIAELGKRFPQTEFVYPVHLNPNVRLPVNAILRESGNKNIHLIDPVPYLQFVALMDRATIILTDSGGIQEEAPSLGKPVLVMRERTERPEGLEAGTAKLVGTDCNKIIEEATRLLTDQNAYAEMAKSHNPYGDGHAARRIVDACARFLGGSA